MIFTPFLTILENDSEMAASRKLKQDHDHQYGAFAESTRLDIHKGFFKAQDATPGQVQYEDLIKQLNSVTVIRHAKEMELARLHQELKDLRRRSHSRTAPRALKEKVKHTMLTLEFQLWDCESYQHVRAHTQQSLQASTDKVHQIQHTLELVDRRLTDANRDLAAVTAVQENEQSQLYLIEEHSSRIISQHAALIARQQASQRETTAMVKRQQDAFISKKYMVQEANRRILLLKTRLNSFVEGRRSILMEKVVCILQLSRVKHNNAKLTETFGTCEADTIIPKFDEFLRESESLKSQIDDKVNSLSSLYLKTTALLHEQDRVREATSLSNLKRNQSVKNKEDILGHAELVEIRRGDSHLTSLCCRTEAMLRLAFNAVCALQSILKRIDQYDARMLLGPRVNLPVGLPQTLDADDISLLLSHTEQRLTTAHTVASQANQERVQRFRLHSHTKLTRSIRTIMHRSGQVPIEMALPLVQSPLSIKGSSSARSLVQSPLSIKGSSSARSLVQGHAQIACKETPTNLTQHETRTSLSRLMSSLRQLGKDDDSEVRTFDRRQFKLDLKKINVTQKVKPAVNSTQCSPRSFAETTSRLLIAIDRSRAQLRLKSHTMSKPISLQSREITRQLKQRLRQISSFRVSTLPKPAEVKSPNRSRGKSK
jgi:hypothetical protein